MARTTPTRTDRSLELCDTSWHDALVWIGQCLREAMCRPEARCLACKPDQSEPQCLYSQGDVDLCVAELAFVQNRPLHLQQARAQTGSRAVSNSTNMVEA